MFPNNLTRDEARSRAATIATDAYVVHLDLSGAGVEDPGGQFSSTSRVQFRGLQSARTHLDLIADRVLSAELDGHPLDPAAFAGSRLSFDVEPGEHELAVTAVFRYSRSGDGLHRFVDPADQRTYLYTQFESADARRVYACFEQPDLKARFAVSVVAPSEWTVVSGGAVIDQQPGPDGCTVTTFDQTPPISTYLTCLVAGEYASVSSAVDAAAGTVPLRVLCRQSLAGYLDADDVFATTRSGFAVFEEHFGLPYPFGKYDQVFVPEYNAGAMENVGCVTLRDEYVFRSKVTQAARNYRRDTILHELAHMWFGDLVTMRWWDDLWLKESFATWSSNFAVSSTADDPGLNWAAFHAGPKTMALRADQLPSTHPIAADIVDLEAVEFNFDQITYGKGAAVLVQLVAFVGRDAFLAGVRAYFAEHAYGNTTLADLLAALEPPSGRDLTTWSKRWLQTAGINTLRMEIETGADGVITAARVRQSAPPEHSTLRPHRLAIGGYDRCEDGLVRGLRIEQDVDGVSTEVPELVGVPRPELVLLNDDDLTFAKIRLDPASARTALAQLPRLGDALSRAVVWGSLWDCCRDAELPARDYADVVLRGVDVETVPAMLGNILAQAGLAVNSYTGPAERDSVQQHWEQGLYDRLGQTEPGSDAQLTLARAFATAANPGWGADLLANWLGEEGLPPGLSLDLDLRWLVVGQLARLGRIDEAGIDAEQRRDTSSAGAERAAGARAARPDATAKREAWRLAVEADTVTNKVQEAICGSFWQRGQSELLAPYAERYLQLAADASALRGAWATKGIALRIDAVRLLFPVPVDRAAFLADLDTWRDATELSSSVARIIAERRDDAIRALRCEEAVTSSTS